MQNWAANYAANGNKALQLWIETNKQFFVFSIDLTSNRCNTGTFINDVTQGGGEEGCHSFDAMYEVGFTTFFSVTEGVWRHLWAFPNYKTLSLDRQIKCKLVNSLKHF